VKRNLEDSAPDDVAHAPAVARHRAKLWFIHINHTNAEIDAPDIVREVMIFPMWPLSARTRRGEGRLEVGEIFQIGRRLVAPNRMGFFEVGHCLGGMPVEAQDVAEQEQAAGKLWAVSWERLAEDVDSGLECFTRSVHIAECQATAPTHARTATSGWRSPRCSRLTANERHQRFRNGERLVGVAPRRVEVAEITGHVRNLLLWLRHDTRLKPLELHADR
jgi:hypothetical protein